MKFLNAFRCWLGLHSGEWSTPYLVQTHGYPLTQHPMDWEVTVNRKCTHCNIVETKVIV